MTEPTYDDFKAVFYDFEFCFRRLDSLHWRDIVGDSLADSFEGAFIRTVSRIHLELSNHERKHFREGAPYHPDRSNLVGDGREVIHGPSD